MKSILLIALQTLVLLCATETTVLAQVDINDHRSCGNCGMDRKAYGFSRMLVQYEDGTVVGTCSLHCAVAELDANPTRTVKSLLVADRDSRTLLDAEKAVWVMGGKKRGVMTERPKWAFASKEDADVFIRANGGKIVTWTEALAAAREDAARKTR
jgi:nitrous oxide reductase accessory protein NosL